MQTLESPIQLPPAFEPLTGENVLFLHAHPDDEAVATSAAMVTLAQAGANVFGVTATDGEASTVGAYVAQSRGRLVELQAAYAEMGIPRVNQYYLGMPDGQLHVPGRRGELAHLLGRIVDTYRMTAIFTPGAEGFDGHLDHIAMDEAGIVVGSMYRLPVWRLNATGQGEAVVPVNPAQKRRFIAPHASQLDIVDDPTHPHGFTVPRLGPGYDDLLYTKETYDRLVY